ncbi:hypothetical protein I553_3855 [Mycobacterium xenopi 4042]|uniref:Uncharacterized protein n=2 Tax=Mycobacterium xenopi 4042 TaxID=1299334 RepID=X8AN81_MYCXE|nr:hypothetical protein I553_3855 [Mycobacterium xenopi 4042]
MTSGYGPVGAEFTGAVAEFQSAFFESGSQLSRRYQSHAEHIRQASGRYVAGDDDGARVSTTRRPSENPCDTVSRHGQHGWVSLCPDRLAWAVAAGQTLWLQIPTGAAMADNTSDFFSAKAFHRACDRSGMTKKAIAAALGVTRRR